MKNIVSLLPGLGVAATATAVAWPVSMAAPVLSPLLVAIVLGIIVGNVLPELPQTFQPGLAFAAKPLLRLGIVALGAQVVLGDILELGWLVLVLAAVVVAVGIVSGLLLARPFRVESNLALLIGCGFGICGAAAVAGVESTLKSKKEDVAAAIGLVVLFGTLMIALIPSLSAAFGLAPDTAGMWGGASTHEVAQVVAIGGIIGPAALQVAVLVKLSRVIMLAPTVAVLSMVMRRNDTRERAAVTSSVDSPAEVARQSSSTAQSSSTVQSSSTPQSPSPAAKRPPIVPLFVLGFLLMAGLRTFGLLPEFAVSGLGWIQTVCLAMAMFALGRGVQWRSLRNLGAGPIGLAATTTLIVTVIGLGGALLLT
ncbi:YeiH family protein [Brevibacterium sp.]|uniref:YeiH family protein n=1 Tax=Brevibacterium sp. TaxID=1701 RepID=UPI0026499D46|nr:putative sulfate exporter family transporter [Brevibacterium sp.]MDN6156911.1 putative sulfate exporter family transporter [Brevibacterium sp.]MDN6604130.1 putative sulfate exporter family transporter [Brevibacterium sp.]MDN6667478.1 putative sulfate exporter family transporter [Brevibacterium sp.]